MIFPAPKCEYGQTLSVGETLACLILSVVREKKRDELVDMKAMTAFVLGVPLGACYGRKQWAASRFPACSLKNTSRTFEAGQIG